MARKIVFNIGFTLLATVGIVIIAFFRWTHLFGSITSLILEDVTTGDLEKEGLCRDTQTFLHLRQKIRAPTANEASLDQGHHLVSDLIARTEQDGARKSLVLRTARVQISYARGQMPSEEDRNFIRAAVQDSRYPLGTRLKARNILYKIEKRLGGR